MIQTEEKFAQGDTFVASYKTLLSVLVELDFAEEKGYSPEMVELTRLDHGVLEGTPRPNALTTIREMRSQLGIKDQKVITLAPIRGRRGYLGPVILTQPLGPYYTKITLTSRELGLDQTNSIWNEQPIVHCDMLVYRNGHDISSHYVRRCDELTLTFEDRNTSEILDLLMGIVCYCRTLNIKHSSFNDRMGLAYYARLKHKWPNLRHVRKG